MKIKLGAMTLWLGIMHAMDMVLTSKELFLKLAGPQKQAKSLKTALSRIVNEKYYIKWVYKIHCIKCHINSL